MPLEDDSVKNGTLDATLTYWNTLGSLEYALFNDDPDNGGVEMDSVGGYAPAAFSRTAFINPTTGTVATTSSPVSFGTSTAAWTAGGNPDVATWWQLRKVGGSVLVYKAPLTGDGINVSGAGQQVAFQPSIPVK